MSNITDKFVLKKLVGGGGSEDKNVLEGVDVLYFLYRKLGYEQTLELPIPVFRGIIKSFGKVEDQPFKND